MYTKARNIIAFILEKIVKFNKLIPTKNIVIQNQNKLKTIK